MGAAPRRASRTAVFMCQGRAVADGRLAVGRFSDPVAARLLRPEELEAVAAARSGTPPSTARDRVRFEALAACAEVVAPRTVAIDDAVGAAGHPQVVVVGAGLDSRPWRLAELGRADVFAVDHPASQADARERSAGLEPVARRLELVAVDLASDPLGSALERAAHDASAPTTWVWEGVVPYLTRAQVEATLREVAARSAPGSVLVVNYQAPSLVTTLGRRLSRVVARLASYDNPLAGEPWRSLWTQERMRVLLARHGFSVRRDEDLLAIAARIGSPAARRRSLAGGRVAVAASA